MNEDNQECRNQELLLLWIISPAGLDDFSERPVARPATPKATHSGVD